MWSCVVLGMEVRPRRAREAFWRWEQAWARRTRDMVVRTDGEECDFGQRNGKVGVRRVVEVVDYLLVLFFFFFFGFDADCWRSLLVGVV